MLSIIRSAGFSVAEFALLLNVSRIAVHNWTAKPPRTKPHRLLQSDVTAALALLRALTHKKELPLSADLDRDERKVAITKLKKRLKDYYTAG